MTPADLDGSNVVDRRGESPLMAWLRNYQAQLAEQAANRKFMRQQMADATTTIRNPGMPDSITSDAQMYHINHGGGPFDRIRSFLLGDDR